MRIHIRRPTTDKSFCEKVDARDPSANVVDLEDRERSTCKLCRATFGRVMYLERTRYRALGKKPRR